MIPVFIINLDRDQQRLEGTINQLKQFQFLSLIRFPAFAGRTVPSPACHILTGNSWSHEHKGTLGCFLSHLGVWELVASLTGGTFALVTEDNAVFENCEMLNGLVLPENTDLVFCNARTAYPDGEPDSNLPRFRSVEPIPGFVEKHGFASGTDGYLLTASGARKLIEYVSKDRLFSHVDLRLVAYALKSDESQDPSAFNKAARTILQFRREFDKTHVLNAYSLFPFVTKRLVGLPSTRVIEDNEGRLSNNG